MNEESIRAELAKILETEPNNYNKIIELSSKLVTYDDSFIRFSVDAGVIDRLGTELVARQETAVSELVKNSYDADAKKVVLRFIDSDSVGGTLIIEDNGIGMTKDQLVNGFMRISSTDKIHNPSSVRYNRKRSGQKGVGRFAVQRLGSKLTITTQTITSDIALVLTIEWNDYKGDIDLSTISNKIFTTSKRKEEGTTLKIEGLRDRWSHAAIKRIYRYVGAIIQPFSLSEQNEVLNHSDDPGFKTVFKKTDGENTTTIADETSMIYDHALAVIEGSIDENGFGLYLIESRKLNINEIGKIGSDPENEDSPFSELTNIKFRAYYYVYNANLIPKMQETTIKALSRTMGGMRLYRNGFRVLPYGETGNDWLKLDASIVKRSLLPVHANQNFFGFVEIKDNNGKFNETSSREGLIQNEAFIQLQNFVYRTLLTGVIKTAEVRNIKIVSGQKKEGNIYEKIEVRIKDVAHTLEVLDRELEKEENSIQVKRSRRQKIDKLKKDLKKIAALQKEEQNRFLKEKSMLRVLSSVGLTIGQFIHEVKDYIINMQSDVAFLMEKLQAEHILFERVLILEKNVTTFQTYTSYFDSVISQNVARELKPIELQNTIEAFWDSIKNDALKSDIVIQVPERKSFYIYTLPMHPSEWSSILFNFYTNSKKAIKRARSTGIIKLECGFCEGGIFLEFSDTGDGIPEEIEERIFEEFFTTSAPTSYEDLSVSNEITGTGLGLKIVKDIVTSYRGNIEVVSPSDGYSTCIRIEVPKATDKELDKYGL